MTVGEFDCKLDAKNRFMLPSRLRNEIDGTIVITKSIDGKVLSIFEQTAFYSKYEEIKNSNLSSVKKNSLLRFLSSNSATLTLDQSGRILLPQNLKDYLGLCDNSIKVLGLFEKIEIWNPDEYKKQNGFDEAIKDLEDCGVLL